MMLSSYETFQSFIASLSLGEDCRLPGALPNSSARYDLAVVVSRPVSIFLRVLTGFFIPGGKDNPTLTSAQNSESPTQL
jgi:hypothetical protein